MPGDQIVKTASWHNDDNDLCALPLPLLVYSNGEGSECIKDHDVTNHSCSSQWDNKSFYMVINNALQLDLLETID